MSQFRFDEETALSIIFANTKRKKRNVDLVTLAKTCEYLVNIYGSQQALAKKVGLSAEMIRELLIPLKLPKEIQKFVVERKIDSIDVVREISALKEPTKQITAANAFMNSASKDVRDIKRLIKDASMSLKNAKRVIQEAKPKGLHILLMDFEDETYKSITKEAKNKKINPAELVREIVKQWVKKKTKARDRLGAG